jgi:hypothetical protein
MLIEIKVRSKEEATKPWEEIPTRADLHNLDFVKALDLVDRDLLNFAELRWNEIGSPAGHYVPGKFFVPRNTVIKEITNLVTKEPVEEKQLWPYPAIEIKYDKGDYTWTETSREVYYEQLECLPPAAMDRRVFAVGEPWKHDALGALHAVFIEHNDKYYCAIKPLLLWNPKTFIAELAYQLSKESELM